MRKKVLLMGKSGSGKTSMRSVIFANYIARDTRRLAPTMDVEHTHLRLLGGLVLNLWDCGGQEGFMESYFVDQKENIFKNVEVLVYVFDVESDEIQKDIDYYQACLDAVNQNSPGAKIFGLIHKMDLITPDQREQLFNDRRQYLEAAADPFKCTCFATSIWDESLYKAWSKIVYNLIPNIQLLERSLTQLCDILEADEIILFERATFLEIACHVRKAHSDSHRIDKISSIIKRFKLSCNKIGSNFSTIELKNKYFSTFVDVLTANTYVMVIMSDPTIAPSATLLSIKNARKHFEKLEKSGNPHPAFAGL